MDDLNELSLPGFTIWVPATWTSCRDIDDPDSILVTIDETDKFSITIGTKSRSLSSIQNLVVEHINIEEIVDEENGSQTINETTTIKTKTLQSDVHPDSIAGREVKCLIPRKPGHGATGIFFEGSISLNSTTLPLSFVAFNLKPENERLFLKAIRTLTFRPISN